MDKTRVIPKILPVKPPPNEYVKPLSPLLPQPPACVLMCSPVRTGKSTIISNLLLNEDFYGQEYFDQVKVISNTINNDVTSRFLKDAFDVSDTYSDQQIIDIVNHQKSYAKHDQPEIALILDDCLGSVKRESVVNHLASRFRHYNIKLLLFSTQVFKSCGTVIRQNATNLIVGSPFPNKKELEKIAEEFGDCFGGKDQFLKIYRLATPNRYDFLHCDLQNNPPLAYHNMESLVAKGPHIVIGDHGDNQNDEILENSEQIKK